MPIIEGSDGGIGRHAGLKIQWAAMPVRVQVPLRVQVYNHYSISSDFFIPNTYLMETAVAFATSNKKTKIYHYLY